MRERVSVINFLWVPAVMYAVSIPAFLAGRPITAPFSIYFNQTSEYQTLSSNAANFWGPFNLIEDGYATFFKCALFLCASVLTAGFYIVMSHRQTEKLCDFDLGIFFAWTCFMFLPCMHERYQYPVEVMLVISAISSGRRSTACVAFLAELCVLLIYVQYFGGVRVSQLVLSQ